MAPKNSKSTPVTALPEYATVLAQCVAQRSSDGGAPALVAATDRGRVSVFDICRLVERRDDDDEDGNGGGQDSVMAAFSLCERILSMATKGSDVILGEFGSQDGHKSHHLFNDMLAKESPVSVTTRWLQEGPVASRASPCPQ